MKFERLLIEKQLIEKKRKEDELLRKIEEIQREKDETIKNRIHLENLNVEEQINKELRNREQKQLAQQQDIINRQNQRFNN